MLRQFDQKTMTSDKLMISRDKALSGSWGDNDTQKIWGELTNIAILMASEKIKKREFKTAKELYEYLRGFRQLIGVILAHEDETGKLRRGLGPLHTPISNLPDSRYRDIYPEFQEWVLPLIKDKGEVTFEGKIKDKHYLRTRVTKDSERSFRVYHCDPSVFDILDSKANELFKALVDNPAMGKIEKQSKIAEVFFYFADEAPCQRGAASIAQMMFHAMEHAFLGEMHYLGKAGGKYTQQAVSPDLAAMLSRDFNEFYEYFQNFIIDKSIKVDETEYAKNSHDNRLDSRSMEEQKKQLTEELEQKMTILDPSRDELKSNQYLMRLAELFFHALQFLRHMIDTCDSPSKLIVLEGFFENLKKGITDEKRFCYDFYFSLPEDQRKRWLKPMAHKNYNSQTIEDVEKSLEGLKTLMGSLWSFCDIMAELKGRETGGRHHKKYHYVPRQAMDFLVVEQRERGFSFLGEMLNVCDFMLKKEKNMGMVFDQFVGVIAGFEQGKTDEEIFNELPVTAEEKNNYTGGKNFSLRTIRQWKGNVEKLKEGLRALAPLWDTLNFEHPLARQYVLGEAPPKKSPTP